MSIWQKQLKATNALIKMLDLMNIYCSGYLFTSTYMKMHKMEAGNNALKNAHNAKDSEIERFWQFLF